jgi:hypothetical protein
VKDEGFNLNAMTDAINSIVSCETLGLKESFLGTCYGHFFFFKACQYATTNEKVCRISSLFLSSSHKELFLIASFGPKNLKRESRKYVFIKCTQGDFKKCITWPKTIGRKK